MKTAAVIIDKWKLAIFTRHLRDAGFSYDTAPGLTDSTLTLKVPVADVAALHKVVVTAQTECDEARHAKGGT